MENLGIRHSRSTPVPDEIISGFRKVGNYSWSRADTPREKELAKKYDGLLQNGSQILGKMQVSGITNDLPKTSLYNNEGDILENIGNFNEYLRENSSKFSPDQKKLVGEWNSMQDDLGEAIGEMKARNVIPEELDTQHSSGRRHHEWFPSDSQRERFAPPRHRFPPTFENSGCRSRGEGVWDGANARLDSLIRSVVDCFKDNYIKSLQADWQNFLGARDCGDRPGQGYTGLKDLLADFLFYKAFGNAGDSGGCSGYRAAHHCCCSMRFC